MTTQNEPLVLLSMPIHFQGWIASLSNGRTVFETPPVEGELTAWQKLLSLCRETGVKITMLRLQRNGVTVHSMPSKMCSGYMQAYEVERIVFRDRTKRKQGIGSVVEDQVFITWVDLDPQENGMVYIWQEARPLSTCKIHTTLRE